MRAAEWIERIEVEAASDCLGLLDKETDNMSDRELWRNACTCNFKELTKSGEIFHSTIDRWQGNSTECNKEDLKDNQAGTVNETKTTQRSNKHKTENMNK